MRDFWTDGSSARQSWRDPTYHPSPSTLRHNQRIEIQYVATIDTWRHNHPTQAALIDVTNKCKTKIKLMCAAIPTHKIAIANAGMLLATEWLNYAICVILSLVNILHWICCIIALTQHAPPEIIYTSAVMTPVVCTIIILLLQYTRILQRHSDRAATLRKRKNITRSFKQTIFIFTRTLMLLYCIVVPYLAKIFSFMIQ